MQAFCWRDDCSAHNKIAGKCDVMTLDQSQTELMLFICKIGFPKTQKEGIGARWHDCELTLRFIKMCYSKHWFLQLVFGAILRLCAEGTDSQDTHHITCEITSEISSENRLERTKACVRLKWIEKGNNFNHIWEVCCWKWSYLDVFFHLNPLVWKECKSICKIDNSLMVWGFNAALKLSSTRCACACVFSNNQGNEILPGKFLQEKEKRGIVANDCRE